MLYLIWHIATQGYEPTKLIPDPLSMCKYLHKIRTSREYESMDQGSVLVVGNKLEVKYVLHNQKLSRFYSLKSIKSNEDYIDILYYLGVEVKQ